MKKFFERLALFRRRLRTFNGRGYVQLIGQPEYSWFRLTPAVMAVEPYSRWRADMDFTQPCAYHRISAAINGNPKRINQMVKLRKNNTLDLSDEFAATGYPGPYNVITTTTGGKTGTEIIHIEVSPVSHPDVVVHAQTTMRDLQKARIDIDYVSIIHNTAGDYDGDVMALRRKQRGSPWKKKFYTPSKKPQQPNQLVQRLMDRLGGNLEPT